MIPDLEKARTSYAQALDIAIRALEQSPQDPARHALAGLIYAGLGRKQDALREGNRARELLPESRDALDGPLISLAMAKICAITGETEQALDLVEHSLQVPAGTNVHELQMDPTWDVLRNHPMFRKLIQQAG